MKHYIKPFLAIGLCLSFFTSFSQQNADTAKANKEALATLNAYFTALKEHDISKAISYFSNSKDFLIVSNGQALDYEQFTTGARTTFAQMKTLLLRNDSIYIRNINENAVLITGVLHQSVTDTNDRQYEYNVTASVVLLKRQGQWKLTYITQVVQPQ